jgi:hypothetical protein
MKKLFVVLAQLVVTASTFSQPIIAGTGIVPAPLQDDESERRRIQTERAREEASYQTEEAACYARFAVTDCIRQARVHRREALDKLRRQELALNEIERKRKAQAQLEQIKEKSSSQRLEEEAAQRLEARQTQLEREERAREKASASVKPKPAQVEGGSAQKNVAPGRTADDLSYEQKQYNDKLKEAQEHRASREKSNKEKSGTPVKPLPEAP